MEADLNIAAAEDTIVALGTAEGHAALSVVRLSGPRAIELVDGCFFKKNLSKQASHTLHVGTMHDPRTGAFIDQVVVGLYHAPRSYTGEDVVEVSAHGSPYVVRRLLRLFCMQGARLAQAGEFSRRAFMNGKMDLAQLEAVAGLIAAESEQAHRVVSQQLRGKVSDHIEALSKTLTAFAAMLELELDFSEEDVCFAKRESLRKELSNIRQELAMMMDRFERAQAFREGVELVLVGAPNVGKSTLFNALLEEEKAMVSPTAGTTRDYLEGELRIGGIRFRLTDTAGLRNSNDPLEQEGVRRSKARMQQAQLLLLIADLSHHTNPNTLKAYRQTCAQGKQKQLLIGNKVDQLSMDTRKALKANMPALLMLSAKTGEGMEELRNTLQERVLKGSTPEGGIWVSELRHQELLQQADNALKRTQTGMENNLGSELLAADVNEALRAFAQITGKSYDQAILEHIFVRFCIGK